MIAYSPLDGDVRQKAISYRPRTCFVMTQLGEPLPERLADLRAEVTRSIKAANLFEFDASDQVTGRDFLLKIWEIILSVPVGIAIVTEELPPSTLANIFYELGLMHALGKETLVVKTPEARVPSDFVRTEYVVSGDRLAARLAKFFAALVERSAYYALMAETVAENPLLAVDYYRRSYLISGDAGTQDRAREIVEDRYLNPQLSALRIPSLIDMTWMR